MVHGVYQIISITISRLSSRTRGSAKCAVIDSQQVVWNYDKTHTNNFGCTELRFCLRCPEREQCSYLQTRAELPCAVYLLGGTRREPPRHDCSGMDSAQSHSEQALPIGTLRRRASRWRTASLSILLVVRWQERPATRPRQLENGPADCCQVTGKSATRPDRRRAVLPQHGYQSAVEA